MAADSEEFLGERSMRVGFAKLTRAPDGSVAGAAGEAGDAYVFSNWFKNGSKEDERPKYREGDDRPTFLIARPDGTLWRDDGRGNLFPVVPPYATGEPTSATFCHAAMLAGLSAEEAVRLTIKHCIYVGGEPQVERVCPKPILVLDKRFLKPDGTPNIIDGGWMGS